MTTAAWLWRAQMAGVPRDGCIPCLRAAFTSRIARMQASRAVLGPGQAALRRPGATGPGSRTSRLAPRRATRGADLTYENGMLPRPAATAEFACMSWGCSARRLCSWIARHEEIKRIADEIESRRIEMG